MSYNKIIEASFMLVTNACVGYLFRQYFESIIYDYFAIWSFTIAIVYVPSSIYLLMMKHSKQLLSLI